MDVDGKAYSYEEFVRFYGIQKGNEKWKEAGVVK